MCGAEGARILTEINRLPQSAPVLPTQKSGVGEGLCGSAARPGLAALRFGCSVSCRLDAPEAGWTQDSGRFGGGGMDGFPGRRGETLGAGTAHAIQDEADSR